MRPVFRLSRLLLIAAGFAAAATAAHADRTWPTSTKPVRKEADKPWLGVTIRVGSHGVLIEEVVPLTPAEAAGLQVGDHIFRVEGQEVSSPSQLQSVIEQYSVGQEVELRIWRDDRRRTLSATLARRLLDDEVPDWRWRNRAAPEFAFDVALGSAPGKLSAMRGDVVLLALFGPEWANASVSARLSALVDRHGKRGLWVVGALKRDDVRELRDLACRDGAKFSVVRDPKDELRRTYLKEARFAGPTLVVIDRDGIVRMVAHGAERLDAIEAALKDALRDRNGVELD